MTTVLVSMLFLWSIIFSMESSREAFYILLTPFDAQNLDLPPPPTPTGGLKGLGIQLNFEPPEFIQ
jgi:hypothetical protein